ncbi:hypothetical protein D9C73_003877 [Collichthys lucidus]|uniref:Uncharacterized protein n=1 Tax=Collichthys lucidus TaxID=240159 RepID=A0A4U5U7E0_COLLU|nr:hypothetical protein D9C73_003877 [Collichthys lucidus]
MGHSGHEGQSYHCSPAGSGSSGPLIDPSPDEQTAALDVTLFPHPGPLALARTQTDSLMGHQTKLPVWLASTKDTGLALPHSKTVVSAPLCGRGWQQQMEISKRGEG